MKQLLNKIIKSIPLIGRWKIYSEKYFSLHAEPGKYNSPITTWEEVKKNDYFITEIKTNVSDITLNTHYQLELLKLFEPYMLNFPFSSEQTEKHRYFFQNQMFGYNDGVFLYCILNHIKPKRIIEIGSGFSSALMLDTFEENNLPIEFTFIDPYTDRVDQLIKADELIKLNYVRQPVQKVSKDIYLKLMENDILFIDSSHIVKTGADLNFLFFEVFPLLSSGVLIHIHDIFFPFEYTEEWIKNGFCYNEAYFLRAFLMNNKDYEIIFWNDFMVRSQQDWFRKINPAFIDGKGGSIYIRKK